MIKELNKKIVKLIILGGILLVAQAGWAMVEVSFDPASASFAPGATFEVKILLYPTADATVRGIAANTYYDTSFLEFVNFGEQDLITVSALGGKTNSESDDGGRGTIIYGKIIRNSSDYLTLNAFTSYTVYSVIFKVKSEVTGITTLEFDTDPNTYGDDLVIMDANRQNIVLRNWTPAIYTIIVPLEITTTSLPDGTVGTAYSATLQAKGGSGSGYSWSLVEGSGSLPAGLNLNSNNGEISGIPEVADTYSFTVQVTDTDNHTAIKALGINIKPAEVENQAPVAYDVEVSTTKETAVTITLNATDANNDPLTYEVVTTSSSNGILSEISGNQVIYTPNAGFVGEDLFTYKANDGKVDSNVATVKVNVTEEAIVPPVATLEITTTSLPDGTVGTAYSATLQAKGGSGSGYTWSWSPAEGSSLPAGLNLNSNNGEIAGTPEVAGTFSFTVQVTDTDNHTAIKALGINIKPAEVENRAPVAYDVKVSTTKETAVTITLNATDADNNPLTYSIVDSSSTNGTLSEISENQVTYTPNVGFIGEDVFTYKANDGKVDSNVATVEVNVTTPPEVATLEISTSSLPDGTVEVAYSATLQATGGSGSGYSWSLVEGSGSLPAELSLNNNTGEIAGTPEVAGTFSFTVQVSDGQNTDTQELTLKINEAKVPDALTVTTPNGREIWLEETSQNITWTSTGSIAQVKIELSLDGGWGYQEIVAATENDGANSWSIPKGIASTKCLIRISDLDGNPMDTSDNLFEIQAQPIPAPIISSVSWKENEDAGYVYGTLIISGSHFGESGKVQIDDLTAAEVYSWSESKIEVGVPLEIEGNYLIAGVRNITVTANEKTSNPVTFELKPRIYSLEPRSGKVGDSISITGTAYGVDFAQVLVSFDGLKPNPTSANNTTLAVMVPEGVEKGKTVEVTVTVNGLTSNPMNFYVEEDPKPEQVVSPSSITFTAYINGDSTDPTSHTLLVSNAQVGTGSFDFAISSSVEWIKVSSANGSASDLSSAVVAVSIDLGKIPNGKGTYSGTITVAAKGEVNGSPDEVTVILEVKEVAAPTITEVNPDSAPAGTQVEISGNNFGETQGTSQVRFSKNGTSVYSRVISWSNTKIEVEIPTALSVGTYDVDISRRVVAAAQINVETTSNPVSFTVTALQTAALAIIYPNPFNPVKETVTIQFVRNGSTNVAIYIYDATARLMKKEIVPTNANQISWNGRDTSGALVGDGLYLVRVVNEDTKALMAKGKALVIKR